MYAEDEYPRIQNRRNSVLKGQHQLSDCVGVRYFSQYTSSFLCLKVEISTTKPHCLDCLHDFRR